MAHWESLFCLLACVVKDCRIIESWFLTSQHGCQQSGTHSMLQLDWRRWIIEWNIYSELLKGSRACKTQSKYQSDTNKNLILAFSWTVLLSYVKCTKYYCSSVRFSAKPYAKWQEWERDRGKNLRETEVMEAATGHKHTHKHARTQTRTHRLPITISKRDFSGE